jgi:hypothetical protein
MLSWVLGQSAAVVTLSYSGGAKRFECACSVTQAAILLLFNTAQELSLATIRDTLVIPEAELVNIIEACCGFSSLSLVSHAGL